MEGLAEQIIREDEEKRKEELVCLFLGLASLWEPRTLVRCADSRSG